MFDDDNQVFCPSCEEKRVSAKVVKYKKMPKMLAIHLQRFYYSPQLNVYKKLLTAINVPKWIMMECRECFLETTKQRCMYKLRGVVVHIGKTMNGGHYVCAIENDGLWCLYNDDKVRLITDIDVWLLSVHGYSQEHPHERTATMLFYEQIADPANIPLDISMVNL